MGECTSISIYESLKHCSGKTVLPGIRRDVYFVPKSEIVAWPKLPAPATGKTLKQLATYEGNFTLAADKKWRKLEVLTTKSSLSSETQGEYPSQTSMNKGTLNYADTEEEATAFARQAITDQLVFLIPQRNGKYRVLGSESFDMTCKVSQTSGEGDTGTAGTTIEVSTTDVCPAPFYTGKIETESGDISGADGGAFPSA